MLGVTLFIAIMSVALLAMTSSSALVTRGAVDDSVTLRDTDRALDKALSAVRTGVDGSDPADCSTLSFPEVSGISVSCAQTGTPSDPQVVTLVAQLDGQTVGQARVRVRPALANEAGVSGSRVDVCDWQLRVVDGASLATCDAGAQ